MFKIDLFTRHPDAVGETYFAHMCFAAWFAYWLVAAAGAAALHAIFPFLFEKTASEIIARLYHRTRARSVPTA